MRLLSTVAAVLLAWLLGANGAAEALQPSLDADRVLLRRGLH